MKSLYDSILMFLQVLFNPAYRKLCAMLDNIDEFNAWGSELERDVEFKIISIIGARMEQNAIDLANYYEDFCFEVFDGVKERLLEKPEFTLEECRKIVLDDEVYEEFTTKYLRVWRDVVGGEAMMKAREEFRKLLERKIK